MRIYNLYTMKNSKGVGKYYGTWNIVGNTLIWI